MNASEVRAPLPGVERPAGRRAGPRPGRAGSALGHPLRVALLDLLAWRGSVTATEAARELGESSGACSFHLRQLERYGQVEEADGRRGRVRPWRLAAAGIDGTTGRPELGETRKPAQTPGPARPHGPRRPEDRAGPGARKTQTAEAGAAEPGDGFRDLARELENEGYRRWLAGRDTAPPGWRDEAFSAVVYLTPDELTEVAAAVRAIIDSAGRPGTPRPGGLAMPVGVVARMFPLLPVSSDD